MEMNVNNATADSRLQESLEGVSRTLEGLETSVIEKRLNIAPTQVLFWNLRVGEIHYVKNQTKQGKYINE